MKEAPILLAASEVLAVLRPSDLTPMTQIRRVEGLEDVNGYAGLLTGEGALGPLGYKGLLPGTRYLAKTSHSAYRRNPGQFHWFYGEQADPREINPIPVKCPYGAVGDRLWGRESFITGWDVESGEVQQFDENGNELPRKVWYAATDDIEWTGDNGQRLDRVPWKSAASMPRWASRILLEITEIRAERLQNIIGHDCVAQGFSLPYGEKKGYPDIDPGVEWELMYLRHDFQKYWNRIYAKKLLYLWAANPWVWVITFRLIAPGLAVEKGTALT